MHDLLTTTSLNASTANAIDMNSENISSVDLTIKYHFTFLFYIINYYLFSIILHYYYYLSHCYTIAWDRLSNQFFCLCMYVSIESFDILWWSCLFFFSRGDIFFKYVNVVIFCLRTIDLKSTKCSLYVGNQEL